MHTVIWDLTDRLSRYKYVPIAPITHHAGTSRSLVRVTDREALEDWCVLGHWTMDLIQKL
jgi:hypothetical protein